MFNKWKVTWGRIFSRVQPFCEYAVSDLDPSGLLYAHSQNGRTQLKIQPLNFHLNAISGTLGVARYASLNNADTCLDSENVNEV